MQWGEWKYDILVTMVPFLKPGRALCLLNYSSDGYTLLYPFLPDPKNPGARYMKTSKQVKEENLAIKRVRKILFFKDSIMIE